jgi:two-component system NtrC family sensor kinase
VAIPTHLHGVSPIPAPAADGSNKDSDLAFQNLLLQLSTAAAEGIEPAALVRLFCRGTREFFQVDGAYFWRFSPPDELHGAAAEGHRADQFIGLTLKASDQAVALDAIQQRRAVFVNRLPQDFSLARKFDGRALMAAPCVVASEVIGAAAFLHTSNPEFFNPDLAAKAAILAGQLGSLLEAIRLTRASREEKRRAEVLAEVAHALHAVPNARAVIEAVADRLRILLRTRVVCVLLRQGGGFSLHTVAAESPQLADLMRARHDRKGLTFAADMASRAVAAGEAIAVSIKADPHLFGDLVPPGMLLAAPFRTAQTEGAVLVYPRDEGVFSGEEKALAAAVAGFGAVALANAELYNSARDQAHELHQLLNITSELSSIGQLDPFMRQFALRAADFLSYGRACIGLLEDGIFHIRWKAEQGETGGIDLPLRPEGSISRALAAKDVFSTDDLSKLGGVEVAWPEDFKPRQLLAVPLLGTGGQVLGMFGVLDRMDGLGISPEDIRRAKLLGSQAAAMLENARLFSRMARAGRHWTEIFDAISDFIVVHDHADNVLRVNRSLADFVGVPPQALIGVSMAALLAVEKAPMLRSCPFCRNAGDDSEEYVHPVLEHTYLVSTSRVHGASSDGMQTIHVLKDITDWRETERRYRELFGNIQEGLFFSTPDGRFVEVNDALVRMLGYDSRESLLQAEIPAQVYLQRERFQEFSLQMQRQGMLRNREETLRRRDGGAVHVLINAFAVRDAQGNIVQHRGLILDVSDLKNYQAELQRERDFSGKILNNTQSLILVVDTAGLISYANRRWFDMGYEQRQLLGLPLQDLIAAPRRAQLSDALNATLEGQQVDNLDLQVLRGDGRVGQFSVNLSPMRDEQGNVTSLVVVMSDVTDAASFQAKLMHAEKMAAVGQLVSGVAHEVNNPLTAILGFADLLMENPELPDSVRRDLRVILQEAQRTKQIVQNLLSFARQMPPQRAAVQLNSILHRTVQLRAYDFNSHGVEVSEHYDESLPQVVGDSQQLQQVFLNILNNAYDAVRESGRPPRIEILTATRGNHVEVWFRDNGHGITHADRIFDPFFTTKEIGKGTGLGLSICYGILREHGGEILCHNNPDGGGATFIVRLPVASEAASVGAAMGVVQR